MLLPKQHYWRYLKASKLQFLMYAADNYAADNYAKLK